MKLHRWNQVPAERLNPRFVRQAIHAQRLTIARIQLLKGALVPEHRHDNEQITTLLEGRLRFVVGGKECVLEPGDLLEIPPSAPHSVEALEDSVAVDIFAPAREDWIRGDDAYLRSQS
jgi:quercetin dioxygenase-like cupin family protein